MDLKMILLYDFIVAAHSINVSIDSDLLGQVDADPEAREKGRSAFISSAVQLYLKAKERQETDSRLGAAYSGRAESLLDEVEELMVRQSWPND